MKRFFFLILSVISQFAIAQTIPVSGSVKDDEGQPMHFAFVQNKGYKYSTYTDSLGNFKLTVTPNSALHISCFGYRDTTFNITNKTEFAITLHIAVNISASNIRKSDNPNSNINFAQMSDDMSRIPQRLPSDTKPVEVTIKAGAGGQSISISVRDETFDATQGAIFPVFYPKEETVGSRYMFKGWVHGYVIDTTGAVVQDPNYGFEYDKMGGGLLLTKDKVSAIEINRDQIKSFTLYDNANVSYTFENVPQIDKTHYVEVVSNGDKYKIYKAIRTSFVKSNYTTDGLTTSGNAYDEYKDEGTYYVYDVQTNALQKITLKKKALKATFAKDGDKLNKFMTDHSSDDIDDTYLSGLGVYMNQ